MIYIKLHKSRISYERLITANIGTLDAAEDGRLSSPSKGNLSASYTFRYCDVSLAVVHVTSPRRTEVHFSLQRSSHIDQSTPHRAEWPSFVDLSLPIPP